MKCPQCKDESGGYYSEIEDFNACNEPEWNYYESWQCSNCDFYLYSYEKGFEWPEEE